MSSDMDEVATLLVILERASAQGTMLGNIREKVLKRLQQIDEEHAPEDVKKAKAAKEKADKEAKEAAAAAHAAEGRDSASKRERA